MAHLVSSASKTATGGEEAAERDDFYSNRFGVSLQELREDGYVIPDGVPSHSWLKRGVGCPENRFGIKPGRFWDGRDRSNGFERDYFREMNRKRHRDKLAFMWSQPFITVINNQSINPYFISFLGNCPCVCHTDR